MRHYLMGQDLWDVVQSSQSPAEEDTRPVEEDMRPAEEDIRPAEDEEDMRPAEEDMRREWIKKSALALHAIKISCGEEMFDKIKDMDSAKDVWDTLADKHNPPIVPQETELPLVGLGNLANLQYETLIEAISSGETWQVTKFFQENSNPRSARIFQNGYTALHFAVYKRKGEIVDSLILIAKLSEKDLETKDDSGSTALSIAARYGVEKSIAQILVRKNHDLLTIADNDGKIPVELACSTIQEDLTRYLYRKTPLEFLRGDRGFYILQQCLTRKMFDIVFDLLHIPELASRNYFSDSIPLILTLAQTPPPFFRGSNLSFWGRAMYNCIRAKAYIREEDKQLSCIRMIKESYQSRGPIFRKEYWGTQIRSIIQIFREEIQDKMQTRIQDTIETRIQNILEGNQRTNGRMIREFQDLSFIGKCGVLLRVLVACILVALLVVLILSVYLIVWAVTIPPSLALNLGKLILGMLLSILSRVGVTDFNEIKLMDEYAREVIRLKCHQTLSELDQNQFVQSRAVEATFYAIKNGIPDIVEEITKINANILWSSTDPEDSRSAIQNIFACSVAHRQERVAHLLYESAKEKNMLFTTDEDGNNTLHLAAKLAPNYQLGYIHAAALQLQSEIRWFKAVKEIVPRAYREAKNKDSETPLEVFVREHKQLLKEAEQWVMKTAKSSTVVGALIITIMFAVAFTAPGGDDQRTGLPVLLHKAPTPFMIFMVSDAISLFTATSSVLMFLGILTSHHSDEDYRKSFLLIIGLTSLFISIATMTTAFCAALFIMLRGQGGLGLVIPMTLLAGIPIVCYVLLQFPLLVEILGLTFSSNIFGKKGTSWMSGSTADMTAWGMRGLRG